MNIYINIVQKLLKKQSQQQRESIEKQIKAEGDLANANLKTVKIVHTNYLDNPHLPAEYIQALLLMKATNEVYYKIYALGEFGSLDKLIYNNW